MIRMIRVASSRSEADDKETEEEKERKRKEEEEEKNKQNDPTNLSKQREKDLNDYKKLFHQSREDKFRCCLTTFLILVFWILFSIMTTLFILYSLRPGFQVKLRSSGNLPSNIGNIHVFYNKMYGVIDAKTFGPEEADVICRQLNYTKAKAFSRNLFPQFFKPEFVITDLKCEMEDKLLDDCSYEISYDSSTSNIAGVICLNDSESLNSSNVIVIGGLPFTANSQGYLGPICKDKFWKRIEGHILCKELGFKTIDGNENATSNQIHQPFAMNSVSCIGNETSISNCNYLIGSCKSDEPVTVNCKE